MEENILTARYKFVPYCGLPVRLIIVRPLEKGEKEDQFNTFKGEVIESPRTSMFRFIIKKVNHDDILAFFGKYLKDYSPKDIRMLYFEAYNDIFDQFNLIADLISDGYKDKQIIETIGEDNLYPNETYEFYKLNIKLINNPTGIELRIKNEVNLFTSSLDKNESYNHYDSYNSIEEEHDKWFSVPNLKDPSDYFTSTDSIQSQIILDLIKLDEIRERNKVLSSIPTENNNLLFTPIDIKSTSLLYKPVDDKGKEFTEEDGYNIFSGASVSQYIPYIRYVDHKGTSWTKLYKEESVDEIPNYDNIIVKIIGSDKKNIITAIVWLGEIKNPNKKMYESQKDTFFKIVYDLDKERPDYNVMEIETITFKNKKYDTYTVDKVKEAFPMLNLVGAPKEGKIRCEFNIYNITLEEKSFFHLIQNNTPYNYFFKTLEKHIYFAFKKNVQLGYYQEKLLNEDEEPDIKFVVNSLTTINSENKEIVKNKNKIVTENIDAGVDYIRVIVNRSNSRKLLFSFIKALKICLVAYQSQNGKNNKEYIDQIYANYLPNLHDLSNTDNIKEKSIIKHLKDIAPEIFVGGYARVCQPNRQPIIISVKEKKLWEDKGLVPRAFPKENPYLFVCPRDPNKKNDAVHLGIQRNRGLKSRSEFPYVPCCFVKPTDGEDGSYTRYMNDNFTTNPSSKVTILISRPSILPPFKPSYIPSNLIENILKSSGQANIYRRGAVFSPNSFLHCVCDALFPEYAQLKSDKDKEDYVIKLRLQIPDKIHPEVLRQELYEYTPSEIVSIIKNTDSFFDPIYFYRAIEEMFGVNIFIFGIMSGIEKDKSTTEEGYVQVPNYKLFYSNYFNPDRTNILILRNWGSDTNDLLYPQCEILIHCDFVNKIIYKSFDEKMGEICYHFLMDSVETYTCIINRENYADGNPDPENPFFVYKNIYTVINHFKAYSGKPISQYIDPYGKLRAINFEVEGKMITVCTIPSKPENLPSEDRIYEIDYKYAIKYMGMQPSSVSINTSDIIEGLWFKILGMEQSEYIPIKPVSSSVLPGYKEGEKCYILSKNIEVTKRLKKLRKYLNIIVYTIRWLLDLFFNQYQNNNFTELKKEQLLTLKNEYGEQYVENNLIEIFIEWYTVTNEADVPDSAQFYNLDNISYKLPDVQTVEEAFEYFYKITENFIITDKKYKKIIFYNDKFKEKIKANLYDYNELSIKTSNIIKGFYENEDDFESNANTVIFNDNKDLDRWVRNAIQEKTVKNNKYVIKETIEGTDWTIEDPYLLRDEIGKIYIVQNTMDGTKETAMYVGQYWNENMLNLGYESNTKPKTIPDHVIYAVNDIGKLTPVEIITGENNIKDEINFNNPDLKIVQIIYYNQKKSSTGSKKYAALLNLL